MKPLFEVAAKSEFFFLEIFNLNKLFFKYLVKINYQILIFYMKHENDSPIN